MRILYLDLDTLRPDYLGCYGYLRDTSPHIDRIAEEGVVFTNMYCSDAHTPYRAPTEFGNPFEDEPMPPWPTEETVHYHRTLAGPHTPQDLNMFDNRTDPRYPRYPGEIKDMADLKMMFDGYDCGIAYMDSYIGRLQETGRGWALPELKRRHPNEFECQGA